MMREVEIGCREKVGVKRITLKTTRQTLAQPTLWPSWANMHWIHYFKIMALNNILMLFKLWQIMYFHKERPTYNLEAIRGYLAAYWRNLAEETLMGRAHCPTGRAPSTSRACVIFTLLEVPWRVARLPNSPNSLKLSCNWFLYHLDAQWSLMEGNRAFIAWLWINFMSQPTV